MQRTLTQSVRSVAAGRSPAVLATATAAQKYS
jgi:hypothetical protein